MKRRLFPLGELVSKLGCKQIQKRACVRCAMRDVRRAKCDVPAFVRERAGAHARPVFEWRHGARKVAGARAVERMRYFMQVPR